MRNSRIEVIREAPDGLSREVWMFENMTPQFRFDSNCFTWALTQYRKEARKTTRHKFKLEDLSGTWKTAKWRDPKSYDNRVDHNGIERGDVPEPEDVLQEVKEQVFSRVFVKWSPSHD